MEYRIENLDFEFNIVGEKACVKTLTAFEEVPIERISGRIG